MRDTSLNAASTCPLDFSASASASACAFSLLSSITGDAATGGVLTKALFNFTQFPSLSFLNPFAHLERRIIVALSTHSNVRLFFFLDPFGHLILGFIFSFFGSHMPLFAIFLLFLSPFLQREGIIMYIINVYKNISILLIN